MSPQQAGLVLGVHRQTVMVWALKGELETMVAGGRNFVSRADVERIRKAQAEAAKSDQAA